MRISPRHPRGAILLSLVLVLGVIGVATLLLLAQANLNGLVTASDQSKSATVRAAVFGCLDEALIQFTKSTSYSPASIVTPTATCTSAVTNLGGSSRRLQLTYTATGIT